MSVIEVGNEAPAFELPNQDGQTVSLSSFAGKYVLLWWYPRADTPGWTIEGQGFRDRIQDFEKKNTVIFGVSFDSEDDNRAFKEKYEFPYDLLTDAQKSMSIAYGAAETDSARPSRVSVLIGPDGKVSASYAVEDKAGHPDEVLADLNRLSWYLGTDYKIFQSPVFFTRI